MHAFLWFTKTKLKKSNQSKQKARKNCDLIQILFIEKSSSPEVFLGKGVLKICSMFKGEHLCRSVISVKLLWFSPVNLLYIFRTPFYKNTYGRLLLHWAKYTAMHLRLCQTTITEIFGEMFNSWVLLTMEKSSITFGYAQDLP